MAREHRRLGGTLVASLGFRRGEGRGVRLLFATPHAATDLTHPPIPYSRGSKAGLSQSEKVAAAGTAGGHELRKGTLVAGGVSVRGWARDAGLWVYDRLKKDVYKLVYAMTKAATA